MNKSEHIIKILKENRDFFSRVVDIELSDKNVYVFDLTENNNELYDFDLEDTNAFNQYIFNKLKNEKKRLV